MLLINNISSIWRGARSLTVPGIALLMTCALFSCEKKVNIKLPESERRTVLNALLHEDSIVYVRLTKLNHDLSTVFVEEEVNEVELFENGAYKESLFRETRNGQVFYRGRLPVVKGSRYKVVATTPNGRLEGEDAIPGRADVGGVKLLREPDIDGGERVRLTFTLADKADEKNYYRIRLFTVDANHKVGWPIYFTADAKIFNGGDLSFDETYSAYFEDDELFDGKEKTYTLLLDGSFVESVILEVTSLTETSYKYLRSAYRATQNAGNPLAEPTSIFTNVSNGLGVVGGISTSRFFVE